jgi:hypothetical protein
MAINDLLTAANGSVPGNALKPHNCHEAVLGWLLMAKYPALCNVDSLSQGVEKAWLTLRSLAQRYGSNVPKQLTGQWFAQKLYHAGGVRLMRPAGGPTVPFPPNTVAVGDVIYMGNPVMPHHSMVVVQVNGPQALARGFNNGGAFGGPFMKWDPTLRDILDVSRWTAGSEYMGVNGPAQIHRITYATVTSHIPDNMNF